MKLIKGMSVFQKKFLTQVIASCGQWDMDKWFVIQFMYTFSICETVVLKIALSYKANDLSVLTVRAGHTSF